MPSSQALTKCPRVFSGVGTGGTMETVAAHGHTGEEAWTITTMDGEERMSSGVHSMGVFVGYMGYNEHKRTTNKKRKDYFDCDVDTQTLLQCVMKAKSRAVCLRAGWCVHAGPPLRDA